MAANRYLDAQYTLVERDPLKKRCPKLLGKFIYLVTNTATSNVAQKLLENLQNLNVPFYIYNKKEPFLTVPEQKNHF